LGGSGCESGEARGKPSLRGDGDLRAAGIHGPVNFLGGVADRGGEDGGSCGEGEPTLFFFDSAGEVGVGFSPGAHQAGADSCDPDALVAEFGVKALREAEESEFAGDVGEHVGHGELAADAGDVDDGGVALAGFAVKQMRERGVGGVECGKEVGGHGSTVGVEGLVFDGADFDDAGVVDENVDVAEVADGVIDEHGGLVGVGEVGRDEEDVVGGLDGVAFEQGFAGLGEFFDVAGGEDETGAGASVALCQGETETAGAAGDEDDFAAVADTSLRSDGVGSGCGCDAGCCRGGAGQDLDGVEDGSQLLFHG